MVATALARAAPRGTSVNEYLLFLVLGVGTGALYAGLAQGVLVTYRGSGVVNLAQGAIAMFGAYTYFELSTTGRLMVPPLPNPLSIVEGVASWFGATLDLPNIPTFVTIREGGLSSPVALVVTLIVAAAVGWALHTLVFRPLRTAPPLAKAVASVGVILVIQAVIGLRFGSEARTAEPILPSDSITLFGGLVKADRFWLTGVVILTAVALWALFRFTLFGLATRAAAANEKAAVLLGYSPNRVAMLCWILSSVVVTLVAVLAAPMTTLSPGVLTMLVIPALGPVLLARLESVGIATVAAIALGMIDQLLLLLQTKPQFGWLPSNGVRELVPFLVIVVALFLRGSTLPVRGSTEVARLPRAPEIRSVSLLAVVLVMVLVPAQVFLGHEWRQAFTVSAIGAVIALSLVVLTGFVGQISLAQMAIAGCSAFFLTKAAGQWGIPFPVAPVLAAAVAAGVGLLVAIPALRVRGVTLAIVTLGFAYLTDQLVFNNADLVGISAQNDPAPSPSIFGYKFGPLDQLGDGGVPSVPFGLFVSIVLIVVALAVANLRRGSVGRRMLAVRANERAAASVGVDNVRTKLIAFTVSAFVAGIGGGLLAYQNSGRVEPSTFAVFASLTVLAMAYLGGISSVGGGLTAGLLTAGGVASLVVDRIFHMGAWEGLGAGVLLVLTAIANPEGIAAATRHTVHALGHVRRGPKEPPSTVLEAPVAVEVPV